MAINLQNNVSTPAMQAAQFYNELRNVCRTMMLNWRLTLLAGPVNLDKVIVPIIQLKHFRERWQTYLTPANRAYIQTDLGTDVTPDFITIRDAIDGILAWDAVTIPRHPDGSLNERQVNGGIETRTMLTTADTAPVVAYMDTIIATVQITVQ